ncbi:MAG: signal peptide peptidase SppA [Lachnospiraceae bacterium]|nr:signal peptide peptidase SppA [Lachnospiraceae bacterium]
MKTKQIVGIVITCLVIIATGITGILSNVLGNRIIEAQNEAKKGIISEMLSTQVNTKVDLPSSDFIGVINIEGTIGASSAGSWASSSIYNHDLYMDYISQMETASNNKGILLYVDSPGGAVYESDEIYLKLMEYKEITGRPVWAYFAGQACSGGYYISMAADKIYANRNCWTGSIGVIVSLLNCKELYDKLGIKEIDITSGENKSMGSSGLDMTKKQQEIFQGLVDEAYDQFIDIVCDGRGMDEGTVRKIADGRIYSAKQALKNGLVDEIGLLEDAKADFAATEGLPENIRFFAPDNKLSGFMSSIFGAAEKLIPKSESSLADDIIKNKGKGVLMYYAG